jgi:hypothetical protein
LLLLLLYEYVGVEWGERKRERKRGGVKKRQRGKVGVEREGKGE